MVVIIIIIVDDTCFLSFRTAVFVYGIGLIRFLSRV